MLENGAEVNAVTNDYTEGMTALMMAARNGQSDAVSMLLAKGAAASGEGLKASASDLNNWRRQSRRRDAFWP
jgi:ankyrin repeat protein